MVEVGGTEAATYGIGWHVSKKPYILNRDSESTKASQCALTGGSSSKWSRFDRVKLDSKRVYELTRGQARHVHSGNKRLR